MTGSENGNRKQKGLSTRAVKKYSSSLLFEYYSRVRVFGAALTLMQESLQLKLSRMCYGSVS